MRENHFIGYYSLFVMFCLGLGILISLMINKNIFASNPPELGSTFIFNIIINNSRNFFAYLFLFFLSPVLQFFDLVQLAMQISFSVQLNGWLHTIEGLFPHGLLEIPNFIAYQGVSQYILYQLIRERSFKKYWEREKKFVNFYIFSYLTLILAAVIEGWLG